MTPKVLYVAAWGRSGTTILDNILDGYPNVFSAGELRYLWGRGLHQRRSCGCGQPVAECPVWRQILAVAYGSDPPDPRQVMRLQEQHLRTRHTRSLVRGRWPAPVEEYAGLLGRLYRAIHEVTGAELIVDSSKLPADAAVLSRVEGVRAYLLHMVRDARAVAFSWSRPTPHPDRPALMMQHGAAKSTVNWCVWNAMSELVATRYAGRHRRVRYEDLVADPRHEVESVLAWTGVPATGGPFEDRATVRLTTNHTVSGNPRRFSVGGVAIRADDAWRTEQPARARLTATLVGLPFLLRYRYPVAARRGPARGGSVGPP